MGKHTRTLVLILLFLASLSGCVGPRYQITPDIPGGYGVWYVPELKAGMTADSAKATLRETLEAYRTGLQKYNYEFPEPKVFADRIDAPPRSLLFFSNLPGNEIKVHKGRDCFMIRDDNLPFRIELHSLNFDDAKRMADALYFLQQEEEKKNRAIFASQVAIYRSLAVKPHVTEEQRRLIVQANSRREKKDYAGAVELFQEAVKIDAVSYPAAYFNMALLYAEQRRYQPAIYAMKQYLELVPDAKDARAAQDKIYEWEAMMEGK